MVPQGEVVSVLEDSFAVYFLQSLDWTQKVCQPIPFYIPTFSGANPNMFFSLVSKQVGASCAFVQM